MDSSYISGYQAIGIVGGVILSTASLPQIRRVQVRKSAQDISYTFQALLATGMSLKSFYFGYYGIWPLFYPCVFSVSCIIYMMGRKLYLEKLAPRDSSIDDDRGGLDASSGLRRSLLPDDNGNVGGALARNDAVAAPSM